MNGNDLIRWTLFFRGLWTETLYGLICSSSCHSFWYIFLCMRNLVLMRLSLNACVLLLYYVLTMHCGSSLVLSPSFYRFHEKWPYQEKKLSSSERTKNRGSIRHRPPPRPPLINNFLSYDDSCLPCGNNICLIRMFL